MKLLAVSDIHHNLMAVRKLRASENNSFDAIVVAGDIGSKSAAEFFKILKTFKCPILYVYGNWDHELGYDESFGRHCYLVHSNVRALGNFYFTGFSGCPTHWGENPISQQLWRKLRQDHKSILKDLSEAKSLHSKRVEVIGDAKAKKPIERIKKTRAYQQYVFDRKLIKNETLRLNRESVAKAVKSAEADPGRCIVITHERFGHLSKLLPGTLLHLFGHIHQFSDKSFKGTRYVDVAALDRPLPPNPANGRNNRMDFFQDVNAGNYVTIEINRCLEIVAKPIPLNS